MFVLKTCVASAVLVAGCAVSACAQGTLGDRQFYSDWAPYKSSNDQYIKVYYFKVDPSDAAYHVQYVVWYAKKPDLVFYFNAKGQYWCAAPRGHVDRWHVFGDAQKVGRLAEIRSLPELTEPPPIPQTANTDFTAPMLFPTFDGLPLAANP